MKTIDLFTNTNGTKTVIFDGWSAVCGYPHDQPAQGGLSHSAKGGLTYTMKDGRVLANFSNLTIPDRLETFEDLNDYLAGVEYLILRKEEHG